MEGVIQEVRCSGPCCARALEDVLTYTASCYVVGFLYSVVENKQLWRVGVCYFEMARMRDKSPQQTEPASQRSDVIVDIDGNMHSNEALMGSAIEKQGVSEGDRKSDAASKSRPEQTLGRGVLVGFVEFHVRPELFDQGRGENNTTPTDEIRMRSFVDPGWSYTRCIGINQPS